MRSLRTVLLLASAVAASPAAAQLSNHGIAVESGASAAPGGRGGVSVGLALVASTWLEGDVHAFARVAWAAAPETSGRPASPAMLGTAGLRLALGAASVRPHVFVDAGWAWVRRRLGVAGHATFGAGVAVEWFPAGDVSLAPRLAARLVGGAPVVELGLALAAYF